MMCRQRWPRWRAWVFGAVAAMHLLAAGCGTLGTVRGDIEQPEFQAENMPERVLKIAVFSDGLQSDKDIRRLIRESSELMKKQVGISYQITSFNPIEWTSRTDTATMFSDMYDRIRELNLKDNGMDFDVAAGFTSFTAYDYMATILPLLIPVPMTHWLGAIEDINRMLIVIKELSTITFNHEVGHAFILRRGHTASGLMAGVELLPFGNRLINISDYMYPSDREEILKTKWRSFAFNIEIVTDIADCDRDFIGEKPERCRKSGSSQIWEGN